MPKVLVVESVVSCVEVITSCVPRHLCVSKLVLDDHLQQEEVHMDGRKTEQMHACHLKQKKEKFLRHSISKNTMCIKSRGSVQNMVELVCLLIDSGKMAHPMEGIMKLLPVEEVVSEHPGKLTSHTKIGINKI